MTISIFDIFSIGIGPSSSHTVGPMKAASDFLHQLKSQHTLTDVHRLEVSLHGSLAFTGVGHGTDKAILMGLLGEKPDSIDPCTIQDRMDKIHSEKKLLLLKEHEIPYDIEKDLTFDMKKIFDHHPNALVFSAFDKNGNAIFSETYFSIGGGFIISQTQLNNPSDISSLQSAPYPFQHCSDLLAHCEHENKTIAEIMLENEKTWKTESDIKTGILNITTVMQESIDNGCKTKGILPGGLNVKRRAPGLFKNLTTKQKHSNISAKLSCAFNWINAYALAVNEENAAGGRVVTAPTNGAAGIIPSVLAYYKNFCEGTEEGVINFLLTAGAIAILYKQNASISGAEMGCQGEVGVACSMAAGALTAVLGGNIYQVEKAAEIGMEHNLGLTCDPVKGLVQIPCIERNAMASVKAVNATYLALAETGEHKVSLDMVIATMREIGQNMNSIYKETSKGGLAVNVVEC